MEKKVTYSELYATTAKYFLFTGQRTKGNRKNINYTYEITQLLEKNKDIIKNEQLFSNLFSFPRNQFSAVKWVLNTSSLVGLDKLVSVVIANFYNASLGYSYPNQSQIAAICGISERRVSLAVNRMKASGEWLVVPLKISPYEKSVSNRYYLLPPAGYGAIARTYEAIFNNQETNSSLSIQTLTGQEIISYKETSLNLNRVLTASFGELVKRTPSLKEIPIAQIGNVSLPVTIIAKKTFIFQRDIIFEPEVTRKHYASFVKSFTTIKEGK